MALDNKRLSSSPTDEENRSKKRKVLDTLNDEGPLTQEDVIYFQKEAIFRKLSLYKEELLITKKSLENWKKDCNCNSEKLSLLSGWWLNIIETLNANGMVSKSEMDNIDSQRSVLFVGEEVGTNRENFKVMLELRRNILQKILDPLLKKAGINNTDADLKSKVESLLNELSKEKSRRQTLQQERGRYLEDNKELKSKVMELVHQNNRLTSKTLKRTDESLMDDGNKDKDEEEKDIAENNGMKKEETQSVEKISNGVSINEKECEEQVDDLSVQITELKSQVDILTNQIEEESSRSSKCKQEISTYELRLLNLTEDDLQNSIVYKNLISKIEKLNNENGELTNKDSTLINKISELENEHKNVTDKFESKVLEEKKMLQSHLEKAEADLARVRTNRDDLIAKLEIISAEKKSKEIYDELMNTIENQKEEIEKLTSERRNQLTEIAEGDVDIQNLKMQNQTLINELKDMEVAFNQTQAQLNKKFESLINNENIITKLKLEKNKADQKYFAAMRVKESLTNETKTLKIQNARSSELISQLKEFEKLTQSKIKALESNLGNMKIVSVEKTKEIDILKSKLNELINSFDILKKKFDQLSNEKKTSVGKFHEFEETIKSLKRQVEQLKAKNSSHERIIGRYRKRNGDSEKNNSIVEYKEDNTRIEGLISIAKCSICSIRFKDTALKTCGHVFCQECVNNRLNARLRKCPSCNCAFSYNDLLSVHL
ncbi:E3 ubiquitin-protein ligase [Saccharomycopsis crataegensis]|uniref:E3 ubiquitin protein ligase n=1 Tax=Saccharomycopsis crataegensis TaxID=43959 RepID=A0AAV5QW69_9ASCO|nr:E3 ubiquitin-protein ligase [Saccharomycopsis crataegensis]